MHTYKSLLKIKFATFICKENIKFLIMLDYVIDVEIWASIYPMITIITKSDKKVEKKITSK